MLAQGKMLMGPASSRSSVNADDEEARQLVSRALAGDLPAFDSLVEAHWRKVASVARRLLEDSDEVEDVLQETFVRAFEGLRQYRGEASVQTWLLKITVNLCRNRRQAFWRRRVVLLAGQDAPAPQVPDARHDAEMALVAAERERSLRSALARLPEKHRLPILLHFYEDLTGPEIAALLGWNESTVWSRIYAGCRRLRKGLDDDRAL